MAVVVIDTIKPKNQGTFPIVEAADVKVTNDKRLDAALNDKANQSDLTALQTTVAGKASQSDLTALSNTVSNKADKSALAETNAAVAGKQESLSTAQLAACNSGITTELVTQIGANTTAIAGKASASDVATADANLQAQIDNIVSGSTADSEVINARVGADGTSYNTLKARLDGESTSLNTKISDLKDDISSLEDDITIKETEIITGLVETEKYINSSGIVVSGSGETNVIETIVVEPGDVLYVTAGAGWGSCYYSIQNANNDVLGKKNSGSDSASTIEDYEVIVPAGATKIIVSKFFVSEFGVKKFTSYNLKEGYKIDAVYNAFVEYYSDIGVFEKKKYINPSGHAVPTTSDAYTANTVQVTAGETYKIKGTANYGNAFYSITDSEDNVIEKELSNSGDTLQSLEKTLTIPSGAAYLNVSGTYAGYYCKKKSMVISDVKEFANKKWVCIGDSLTEKNARSTVHYYDYVSESTGIEIVNLGVSGSGYMNGAGNNNQFYNRVSSIPLDCDVVTIFGSGNDNQLPLGSVTDNGTETVCGCINKTIDDIVARIPTVSLGIVSPTPWESYPPYLATDNKMKNMVDAMKEICERRSIPFLDLYRCSNLRPWTAEGREACYSKDGGSGVHPDETGHKLIAPRFKSFIESLLI